MDVLSDILTSLRLTGGVVIDGQLRGDFCVLSQFGPDHCAPFFPVPETIIGYHYVRSGEMVVEIDGAPAITLQAGEASKAAADNGTLKGLRAQKALAAYAAGPHKIQLALRYGIPIALGTDAGVGPHGRNAEEFGLMVRAGLTPMQAIVAGTSTAARNFSKSASE